MIEKFSSILCCFHVHYFPLLLFSQSENLQMYQSRSLDYLDKFKCNILNSIRLVKSTFDDVTVMGFQRSSSSSCHIINTDIPDPLSSPLPIVHLFRQILRAISRIYT